MKKIIYSFFFAAAGLFAAQSASAQENVFSGGVELALPLGDFGEANDLGIGASVSYELGLTDNFAVLANAGYIYYMTEGDGYTFGQIPIQLGARYYLAGQREGFFAQVSAGTHLSMSSYDSDLVDNETNADFSLAPHVGFFLTEKLSLDLRYQMIFVPGQEETTTLPTGDTMTIETDATTLGYLGLRVAYMFN